MTEIEEAVLDHEHNKNCVVLLYRIVEDPIDKFIIMALLECGYKEEEVARMFGISQEAISKRFTKAKSLLRIKELEESVIF